MRRLGLGSPPGSVRSVQGSGTRPLLAVWPGEPLEPKARCFRPVAFKKGAFERVRAYPELSSNPCNFRAPRWFIPIPANSGLAGKKKKKIRGLLTGTLLWPLEVYRLD